MEKVILMEGFLHSLRFIGDGLGLSLQLLLGGLLIGLLLGTVFAILRYQGIGSGIIRFFVSILRGTPLILQLSFFYFSIPMFLGFKISILMAGIITFGLNSSAYVSEILRSGIENLPKGQFEAAKTLHIPRFFMWRDIILPQVLRNILPAMANETITLLKETALISTLGGMDMMRRAQAVAAEQFTYFMPLCIAGFYYYLLVLAIEYAGAQLEKKVAYAPHH